MDKNRNLVSVVLPVYNAALYLSEAIQSILNQTYSNFELIIIDDASTDNSWIIITQFAQQDKRIRTFRNERNLKLSKTLNLGIEHASGIYIARMDADDISLPDRLEKQVAYMNMHPEVGISGGSMEIMRATGDVFAKRTYHLNDQDIRSHIFRYSPYSHPLIIMRKTILNKVGGYRDEYNPAEDYELYFRIGAVSKFGNLSDTLLKYRVVDKSMTTGSTRKMELKTIDIRNMYSKDAHYGYSLIDRAYSIAQLLSIYIIPSSLKIYIFNFLRNI